MSTELAKPSHSLNAYLEQPAVIGRLSERLGLEEAKKFKAALLSAVSTNPVLATECEPASVINGTLIGHSLNLLPSPQLGYYYLVPYQNKKKNCKEAQFQMGYKGYIQLAMRSGYYKRLNVAEVKAGEFASWNPLTEEIGVNFITDPIAREKAKTVGYCGYFEYVNGFRKMVYWTIQQVEVHADKYSKAYSLANDKLLKAGKIPQAEMWKYSSFWYSDFDAMAKKTVLRQMLSKWGAMSIEMQTAFEEDIKAETVPFAQAQAVAQGQIEDQAGSKLIDADFEIPGEPDPATKAKAKEQIDKLKEAEKSEQEQPETPPEKLAYYCPTCEGEFNQPVKGKCPCKLTDGTICGSKDIVKQR